MLKEQGFSHGVYDLAADHGWVSVGMDHDTAAFAVQTIRRWWQEIGRIRYPEAKKLFITADGGGSNSSRSRLWKRELQRLANEIGIDITVSHFPLGKSPMTTSPGQSNLSIAMARSSPLAPELGCAYVAT